MKRKIVSVLVLMMLLVFSACGGEEGSPQQEPQEDNSSNNEENDETQSDENDKNREFTLKVAYSGDEALMEIATNIYKEMYPNATVEWVTSTWGTGGADARNKQLILLGSDEQLDVGKVVWGKEFYLEGIIEDLTDEITGLDIFPNLTEGQKNRMSYDGHYYGVTTGNNCVFMYCNMDILEKVGVTEMPKTIEELEALGEKIKAANLTTDDGQPIYLTNFENGMWTTDYWLWAFGGKQMNEDYTETLINSPESVAAYERMQSYIEKGWAPKIDGTGNQAWLNGQLAIYMNGDWVAAPSTEAGLNWQCTTMPVGEGGNNVSIGGVEWVVFKNSELKKEAFDFISIFVSDEYTRQSGNVTDVRLYEDPEMAEVWEEQGTLEAKKTMGEQLKNTTWNFLEAPYSFPEATNIYSTALERILVGMEEPQAVMDAAAEEINAGLATFGN